MEHAPFWAQQSRGLVVGLLRDTGPPTAIRVDVGMPPLTEPMSEARLALRARHVAIWEGRGSATTGPDELWRVVHLEWLTAHEDVRRYVTEPWPGGPRCRFCRIVEPGSSYELNPIGRLGHMVHEACARPWLSWLEIAARYASVKEAREADEAAGRKARESPPPMPKFELESAGPFRAVGAREGRSEQR
jgi:hypothetical protein